MRSPRHAAVIRSCRLIRMAEVSDRTTAECERFASMISARESLSADDGARLADHVLGCRHCAALAGTIASTVDGPAPTIPAAIASAYVLGREVARGGMGRILAADDVRIGRPVALKELLKNTPTLAARFAREARVTARLQHPGIVPIYEIGHWADGTPFYTMRMVEGRTLRAEIADRPVLDARLALLPAMIAAADAVAFAHGRRVIHRDLTPNNVLVGAHGETVVIDWGLAKNLDADDDDSAEPDELRGIDLTSAGTVMGTLAYMPPEQARGDNVDERADVFALGGMLAYLLSGVAPAPTLDDLAENRVAAHALEVPGAPRDLVSIVRKATSPSPADRYPSARELADELRRFQTGRIVEAHAYSRRERARRWIGEHRAAVLASTTLVVGVAIAGGIGLAGVVSARDRAEASADEAKISAAAADRASTAYLEELGRQKLLANAPDQAAVYLSAAYSAGDTSPELRYLLGSAMRVVEAERRTFIGSREPVRAIHVSSDGKRALVVHHTIAEQWSLADGAKLASLEAPNLQLVDATYAGDGATLISWGDDAITRIWSASTGQVVTTLPAGLLSGAALSPDGSAAITVGADGQLRTWDARTAALRDAATPFGRFVGTVGPFLVGIQRERLVLRDWTGHHIEVDHAVHTDASPDGTRIVTCTDKTVTVFMADGRRQIAWDGNGTFSIAHCFFADSGARVFTADASGRVTEWNLYGDAVANEVTFGHATQDVTAVGSRLVAAVPATSSIEVREARSGALVARFPMDTSARFSVVPADRPQLLVPRTDGTVAMIDASPGRLLGETHISTTAGANVTKVITSVATKTTNDIAVLDLATGHEVHLVADGGQYASLAIATLAPRLTVGTDEGVTVYDADTGAVVGHIASGPLLAVEMSQDGTRVVLHRRDGTSELWTADGKTRQAIIDAPPTATLADGQHVGADLLFVGHRLIRIVEGTGRVELIDMDGGPPRVLAEATRARSVDLNGEWLATLDAHVARVLDLATGTIVLEIDAGNADTLSMNRARKLLSVSGDDTKIWDVRTGKLVARLPVAHGRMTGADGEFVITEEGIWSVHDARQLESWGVGDHANPRRMDSLLPADRSSVMFSTPYDRMVNEYDFALRDLRLELRPASSIAELVLRRVPFKLENGGLVPISPDKPPAPAPARVRVTVRDRGVAIPGASVEIVGAKPAITDARGVAELDNLVAGTVQVVASAPTAGTRPRAIYLRPGDSTLELELGEHATISGHVVSETGAPLSGIHLRTEQRRCFSLASRTAITDASGAFTLTGLPGGCVVWVGIVEASPSGGGLVASPEHSSAPFVTTDDAKVDDLVLVAIPTPATKSAVDPPARPVADESHLFSALSDVEAELLFENLRDESVRLYWLDESGVRRSYGRLGSKRTIPINSFVHHAWVVTDDHDKALAVFVPTTRLAHATIH